MLKLQEDLGNIHSASSISINLNHVWASKKVVNIFQVFTPNRKLKNVRAKQSLKQRGIFMKPGVLLQLNSLLSNMCIISCTALNENKFSLSWAFTESRNESSVKRGWTVHNILHF